jgi:hypothetical protein
MFPYPLLVGKHCVHDNIAYRDKSLADQLYCDIVIDRILTDVIVKSSVGILVESLGSEAIK